MVYQYKSAVSWFHGIVQPSCCTNPIHCKNHETTITYHMNHVQSVYACVLDTHLLMFGSLLHLLAVVYTCILHTYMYMYMYILERVHYKWRHTHASLPPGVGPV